MHILTIVGNRPQFVKAAAVSNALREFHAESLIHTGQHYDDALSRVFFEELGIPSPDQELRLGTGSNAQQTGRMVGALDELLDGIPLPDCVLVYGDTNSTLAGALVASQRRIPLVHVEAGMRSFDRSMPEELNRVLTDHASDLLLCSTPTAVTNLQAEGIHDGAELVGDVMADVALRFVGIARERSTVLDDLGITGSTEFTLVTAHRAGNVDSPDRLRQLVHLLISAPGALVFPVHPRTEARLEQYGLRSTLDAAKNVTLTDPVGYLDLLRLLDAAAGVLTDSGGLQKEAYVLGKRCVTMRDTTEWVETVDAGWNTLVDLDAERALSALAVAPPSSHPDLYSAGNATAAVVAALGDSVSPRNARSRFA